MVRLYKKKDHLRGNPDCIPFVKHKINLASWNVRPHDFTAATNERPGPLIAQMKLSHIRAELLMDAKPVCCSVKVSCSLIDAPATQTNILLQYQVKLVAREKGIFSSGPSPQKNKKETSYWPWDLVTNMQQVPYILEGFAVCFRFCLLRLSLSIYLCSPASYWPWVSRDPSAFASKSDGIKGTGHQTLQL